jgi:hypothetical protein
LPFGAFLFRPIFKRGVAYALLAHDLPPPFLKLVAGTRVSGDKLAAVTELLKAAVANRKLSKLGSHPDDLLNCFS